MVRHGRAAASYTDDVDPGLDALGHEQAEKAASLLTACLPLQLVSSPLKRAQETAAPLALTTQGEVHIESKVAEVPSPDLSLEERGPWLKTVMSGRWSQ